MREKKKKFVKSWIEDIPDEKLTGFTTNSKSNVYKTKDLRVDMQGMTTPTTKNGPRNHNLQVQINAGTTISTPKEEAPNTVAQFEVPEMTAENKDSYPTPREIKDGLIASIKLEKTVGKKKLGKK